MSKPDYIALWLPRRDEFDLAAALCMCVVKTFDDAKAWVDTTASDLRRQGLDVRVGRWHVWRVVRTLALRGLTNDSPGRAAAFAILAADNEESADDS